MRTVTPLVVASALAAGAACAAEIPASLTRVCAITLSYAREDRTLTHVLAMLDQAAARQAEIVSLPQECVPTDGGVEAQAALRAISAKAAAHRMVVAANLKERDGDRVYLTTYLIDAQGEVAGKYRKSHRLPDEEIALGDDLPVFDTKHGKVGLMTGTDHYWPEVPLVLALKGAELILWAQGVEPVPQGYPLEIKMRVRAMDDHVTIAGSGYAGALPYLCSGYPRYTGEPLGRGCIIDRSGIVVADTGHHAGTAVAALDLKRGKDVFHLTYGSDRKLFSTLVERDVQPARFTGTRGRVRVSIAQTRSAPSASPESGFARVLDEAGKRGSDLIVMAEFGMPTDTDAGRATLALIAEKARRYKSYIMVGGLRDAELPYRPDHRASWAYLWDRSGRVVGKYRIAQYGGAPGLPVFPTDFGTIGIILCGDIYSQEICRTLALKGAEIIICGTQSWAPSGEVNLWMEQTRAIDNCVAMAVAHFPSSEISQRSSIIDACGYPLAATEYWRDSVATAEIDLDADQVWFARSDKPGTAGQRGYLPAYFPETLPEKRTDFRAVLFAQRRPELYGIITEKSLVRRAIASDIWDAMNKPRPK